MGSRTIVVQNPAQLRTRNNRLVISAETVSEIPLSDIGCIILDNPQILLSSPLLEACSDTGVALITCNNKHIPAGIFLPFNTHFNQRKKLVQQISISKNTLKVVWKKIIFQKIHNQARCLDFAGQSEAALELKELAEQVKSGDPDNIEAIAAARYFKLLFGNTFTREQDSAINANLNYGYALIRATIARAITATGLQPALGIHHCNQFNQFNLVDDLIEPFRPAVDTLVRNIVSSNNLEAIDKPRMLQILQHRVLVNNRKLIIPDSVTFLCNALATCYEKSSSNLRCLPVVLQQSL